MRLKPLGLLEVEHLVKLLYLKRKRAKAGQSARIGKEDIAGKTMIRREVREITIIREVDHGSTEGVQEIKNQRKRAAKSTTGDTVAQVHQTEFTDLLHLIAHSLSICIINTPIHALKSQLI
jgi:hypothetical protein